MAATAATSYPHMYSASPLALCCVLSVLLARLHRACPPLFALFFFFQHAPLGPEVLSLVTKNIFFICPSLVKRAQRRAKGIPPKGMTIPFNAHEG